MRKLIAAAALLAVVFVLGCQDTQKVAELQGQVDKLTQQVSQDSTTIAKLTAERDSVVKLVTELQAKLPAAKGGTIVKPPASKGVKPPVKK